MRFLRVEIRDFRNIQALDLDLTDPATGNPLPVAVLVGPNGAGKTAVLEAVQRLSMPFAYSAARQGMRPLESDVRAGCDEARLSAQFLVSANEAELRRRPDVAPIAAGTRSGVGLSIRRGQGDVVITGLSIFLRPPCDMSPPSLVYLDAARHASRDPIEAVTASRLADTATHAAAPSVQSNRHQWTKQQIVNLKFAQMLARERGEDDPMFDKLWEPVQRVLERIRFREVTPALKIVFATPSGHVEFDDLSAGEKSVILMLTDLTLRRISEATVLIDEIELHLHPRWQATILGALREMLPDCQFIVTTQSPIVAASVREAKYLFKLGDL